MSQCANDHLIAQAPTSPVTTAGSAGTVILRGVTVTLDTEVGRAFVTDCARNTEGLTPDDEIKTKYELSDEEWERLAGNTPVLHAVRAERRRRIANGDAAREGAQRFFAKAPDVLGGILTNDLVSPRHRIDAAKELREVAGNGPDAKPETGEKFLIIINLGDGEEHRYEVDRTPRAPSVLMPPDEDDAPPQ
jgi:hypothetical protein